MKKAFACILCLLFAFTLALPNTASAYTTREERAAQKQQKKMLKRQKKQLKKDIKAQNKATKEWRKHHTSPF